MSLEIEPIGTIRSLFGSKFGVPRQSGLVANEARIELFARVPSEALRGLELASHVWVLFVFHAVPPEEIRPTVRPPRCGGNTRLGVLGTRSPFRYNRIGMSAVQLVSVDDRVIVVNGGDFVDGTPVVDVKPYVPYADRIDDATLPWADAPTAALPVRFAHGVAPPPDLRALIEHVLALDPRPAYRRDDARHGVHLAGHDVRFVVRDGEVTVVEIVEP